MHVLYSRDTFIYFVLILLCFSIPPSSRCAPAPAGNALDTLVLGDKASENAHGLVAKASEMRQDEWQISGAGNIGGSVGGGKMGGGSEEDNFFFHWQKLDGDGFLQARITSLGSNSRQVKTGIMMRESLAPKARMFFALDNAWDQFGPSVMARGEEGGAARIQQFKVEKRPVWMRVERKGNIFMASTSADGKSWSVVATESLAVASSIHMGLTTTSQDVKKLNDAVFDSISSSSPKAAWTDSTVGKVELAGKAEVFGLGERSRKLLPLEPVDYYGGDLTFRMKVDPKAQNYCSIKLWGSEASANRLALVCEGKEVGSRHGGILAMFVEAVGAVSPGSFWYRTTILPRWLTEGKTSVEIKLRSTGSLYAYGKIWNYDTYQHKMQEASRGLYRVYTHTNPLLDPAGEKQGARPDYMTAPVRQTTSEAEGLTRIKSTVNERIRKILANQNPSRGDFDFIAECYDVEWTVAYKKPEVASYLVRELDDSYRKFVAEKSTGGGEWGGGFGPQGLAVHRIAKDIATQLDEKVDLGASIRPRRELWSEMLKASRDSGRFARRTITNQVIIADGNVYKANLGLLALGSKEAFPEKEALRYIREAVGVEEWRGSDLKEGGHQYYFGENTRMVTAKGTTHEWNWCCHNCYGRMSPYVYEFYRLTGDTEIRDIAVQMERAHSALLYPSIDEQGYRAMLNEGVICTRNVYHPGHVGYPYPTVSSSLQDKMLLGGVKQQMDDGQMWDNWFDAALYPHLPDDIAKIKQALATTKDLPKLPTLPGQPDYAWADEQNAILTIKQGKDLHFVTFWRRWGAVTRVGDAHTLTPENERVIQFHIDDVRFDDAGESQKVGPEVQTPFTGTPPDKPESAYSGQVLPKVRLENGRVGSLPDFYGVRYGNFLIAMNCTYGKKFDFAPPGFKGGVDMISGKEMKLPIIVPPQTTYVFLSPAKPETK